MNTDDSKQVETLALALMATLLTMGEDGMIPEAAVKYASRIIRLAIIEQDKLLKEQTRA